MSSEHVRIWQEEIGVPADGQFGPKTLAASMAALQPGPDEPESTEPAEFELTARDLVVLRTIKPELAEVVKRAAKYTSRPFRVFEGLRTRERQKELLARGVSKTMNSRHLTGDAVDLWPLEPDGTTDHHNLKAFREVARAMTKAADDLGFPLTSGGLSWGWDWYHFQRTWGK